MNYPQQRIAKWAYATFGETATAESIAARALKELAELVYLCVQHAKEPRQAMDSELHRQIAEEAADVGIVLARYCDSVGVDMERAAAHEMLDGCCMEWFDNRPIALAHSVANFVVPMTAYARARDPLDALGAIYARLDTLCRFLGQGTLWEQMDKKMEINVRRVWKVDGHGHGQHVA